MASAPFAIWKPRCSNPIATPPVSAKAQTEKEKTMNIGQKMLTFTAMAALSVGSLLAQGTVSRPARPSNQAMTSNMTQEQPTSPSSKKLVDKNVHTHHHKKAQKGSSGTPIQSTATKK